MANSCECGCGKVVTNRFAVGHANKGKLHSKEWRERIGKALLGNSNYLFRKEKTTEERSRISDRMKKDNPHTKPGVTEKVIKANRERGHYLKHSKRMKEDNPICKIIHPLKTDRREEIIAKISESNSGCSNGGWKGGIQFEPYCDIWGDKSYKTDIKSRDNNECQNPECSGVSENIVIHHINYTKKDCHPTNLITLCISCNSKANYSRDHHRRLYSSIIRGKYGKL